MLYPEKYFLTDIQPEFFMRIIESLFLAGMFAIPFSGYGAEKFQEQKLPETPALQKVLKKFSADELFFLERLLP